MSKRTKFFECHFPYHQCNCQHLPIACTLMVFPALWLSLVLGMLPTRRAKPDPTGSDGLLSASHLPLPLRLCQLCTCYHRGAGRDVYSPLLGRDLAASDSLLPTEDQTLVSSLETKYPTPENSQSPHPAGAAPSI